MAGARGARVCDWVDIIHLASGKMNKPEPEPEQQKRLLGHGHIVLTVDVDAGGTPSSSADVQGSPRSPWPAPAPRSSFRPLLRHTHRGFATLFSVWERTRPPGFRELCETERGLRFTVVWLRSSAKLTPSPMLTPKLSSLGHCHSPLLGPRSPAELRLPASPSPSPQRRVAFTAPSPCDSPCS